MGQLGWVRGHLADIESDMSVFHRVDDIWEMPPARFFGFAHRLTAYRGVMRERAIIAQQDQPAQSGPVPEQRPQVARAPSARDKPVTRAALHDPAFKGIFSFG